LLAFGLGLVLAGGLWVGLSAISVAGPTKAPSFSLPRLGGGPRVTVPLTGVGAHDPVVVTFFASWCSPCRGELPTVARVARQAEHSHERVRFVGVDDNDATSSGLAFARASGVGFPVGRDYLSQVAPTYGIPGNPATVFIDGSGDIAKKVLGPVSAAALRGDIAAISGT
jgi:cytochrome c biogenesis protein CcmG, thiol:disulfide interchange protein DsbE